MMIPYNVVLVNRNFSSFDRFFTILTLCTKIYYNDCEILTRRFVKIKKQAFACFFHSPFCHAIRISANIGYRTRFTPSKSSRIMSTAVMAGFP